MIEISLERLGSSFLIFKTLNKTVRGLFDIWKMASEKFQKIGQWDQSFESDCNIKKYKLKIKIIWIIYY